MTKVDSAHCGVDKMVIKTNENFGGDTVTYSVHHVTVDGRIYYRESLAESDDPIDRNISILGFGERFFRYQEAWAIRQLMLKLKDQDLTVRRRAMDEILACFDFSRGFFPEKRVAFLQNPSYSAILSNLHLAVADYCVGRGVPSTQINAVRNLQDLLVSTLEGRDGGSKAS